MNAIDLAVARKNAAQWQWLTAEVMERRIRRRVPWAEAARQTRASLAALCYGDGDDANPEQLTFLAGDVFKRADSDAYAAEDLVRLLIESNQELAEISRKLQAMG